MQDTTEARRGSMIIEDPYERAMHRHFNGGGYDLAHEASGVPADQRLAFLCLATHLIGTHIVLCHGPGQIHPANPRL